MTDYVAGVRVVLCDGSLWQIFFEDRDNTFCVDGCDSTKRRRSYGEMQTLLRALRGGGGAGANAGV